MSPPSLWGLGSSLPSPLRSKELILGENVPARFTPPVGKLSGMPYAGHSLVRFPSIASASVTCPSPFPCVSLSPPTTQDTDGATLGLAGLDAPPFLRYTSCQPHTFLPRSPCLGENTPATSGTQPRWLCPRNFFSWCCKAAEGEK